MRILICGVYYFTKCLSDNIPICSVSYPRLFVTFRWTGIDLMLVIAGDVIPI